MTMTAWLYNAAVGAVLVLWVGTAIGLLSTGTMGFIHRDIKYWPAYLALGSALSFTFFVTFVTVLGRSG